LSPNHSRADTFLDFVLEQLEPFGGVATRSMFGGHGLYRDGAFFAIVYRSALFFKVDDTTRADYTERGMPPFRPSPGQTLKSYYEVPPDVLEKPKALAEWAARSVDCARRAAAKRLKASPSSARSRRERGRRSAQTSARKKPR
jgi:DNA transformation protein